MRRVAGVDEAGRGPLAGPVVAAAVVFPEDYCNPAFKDSKRLSARVREELVQEIKTEALGWSVISVGPRRIEKLNILRASLFAMSLAVQRVQADFVLIDGNQKIKTVLPQKTIIGGDASHVAISAASIIAKVWRDNLMHTLHERYPGYGFDRHVGYPTRAHKEALIMLGPCKIHRRTFCGVAPNAVSL